MTKNEFLKELREALEGMVSPVVTADSMRYYEDYFRSCQGTGKSEQDVIEELGSPRLIAKSIIEANGGEQAVYDSEEIYEDSDSGSYDSSKVYRMDSRKLKIGCAVTAIVTLVILMLLFKVILAYLGPILVIALVIYLITQIMKR